MSPQTREYTNNACLLIVCTYPRPSQMSRSGYRTRHSVWRCTAAPLMEKVATLRSAYSFALQAQYGHWGEVCMRPSAQQ